MNTKETGINVSGYINRDFGLGVAVRANINAIKAAGIPYAVNDVSFAISKEIKEGEHRIENMAEENPYPVNLIQINFDNLSKFFSEKGKNYFKDKYNIGFWAWELDTLPADAKPFFEFLDEIWVPSNFCAEIIAQYSPLPVIKIMHPISPVAGYFERSKYNIPEKAFLFLTMFDYHSTIERKNPIAAIDAYEKAFGKNSAEAVLVVKSSISTKFPEDKSKILNRIGANRSIILIEEILETSHLYGLIDACDCFVSLHRSEGFGLTIAEAMSFGKPVIATAYSGNTDFMNINNSFPVKFSWVSVGEKYYCSSARNLWAEPDITHAAEMMKHVYNDAESAGKVAANAKRDIAENLSLSKIGQKIAHRLDIITADILPSKWDSASKDIYALNFENQILQQKIDALRKLPFVKMKEQFKNFQNKLSGKNRKYFWE